ncbi:MAG: 5'-methylthioadenosine/S-adenosylhomocysteine nucleosidase [Clostridia bacterium]|nr:5'-methylthioadenosine/S-adenosylhomocysteine nucleosidase [Clostridia bacterium]
MISFIIAMEKEAAPLLNNMTDVSQKIANGKKVFIGNLFGHEISVVICGVGKVNAACGAQYAIDCLNADKIVNLGVAGGLDKSMNVADVYAIEKAVQYDFDLTQLNGTAMGTLDEFDENYLSVSSKSVYPLKRLATGDRFNDSKDDFNLLTKELKADIRDMEGAAIAQTCVHAGVSFKSYKIISDIAGSGSTAEQYFKNLGKCFAKLEAELENIMNEVARG